MSTVHMADVGALPCLPPPMAYQGCAILLGTANSHVLRNCAIYSITCVCNAQNYSKSNMLVINCKRLTYCKTFYLLLDIFVYLVYIVEHTEHYISIHERNTT